MNFDLTNLKIFKKKIIKNILDISLIAGSNAAHIGGALSCVDIISVLFNNILNFDKKNYKSELRDRFILSKGHGCLSLYSVLIEKKIIDKKEIKKFEKDDSDFPGHPVKNLIFGIEFSTGSLGMGLSLGAGVALALKRKEINNKVYVLIGDGETNEGSIWETIQFINHYNLDNILIFVDKNNFQQTGLTTEISTNEDLYKKIESFGLNTYNIDGHDLEQIYKTIQKAKESKRPSAIIANTIKGHGIKIFENNNQWHHSVLTKKLYDEICINLK